MQAVGEKFKFYEFFAGGGMARTGLGNKWQCSLSNDFCQKKANAYKLNFGAKDYLVEDVKKVTKDHLPGKAELAWASFPCQDLSIAGKGLGLKGERSGTFWPFWKLMNDLAKDNRKVPIIVLENVVGAITANGGQDFISLLKELSSSGYSFAPIVFDAIKLVPQSRPRLFIVAFDARIPLPKNIVADGPQAAWHPNGLVNVYNRLSPQLKTKWNWLSIQEPPVRESSLKDIVEQHPLSVSWHNSEETQRVLGQMSKAHRSKIQEYEKNKKNFVGTIYRRTRLDENGHKVQRAEVRFDGSGGCLRTPGGGSSRQMVIVVDKGAVKTRLLSSREVARMMGLSDSYKLPENYNEAYHLLGDGLVVPVVAWLERHTLRPLALAARNYQMANV
jgi:DNA (cytosine-5)-methyltransferase 1